MAVCLLGGKAKHQIGVCAGIGGGGEVDGEDGEGF